jgi:transcriptional regulator with XRE-family HTH domain
MTDTLIPEFTVGDRLKKARLAAGISLGEMADALDVGRSTLQRWEKATTAKRSALMLYSMRTGVPVEWIEFGRLDDLPTCREAWQEMTAA